MPHQPFTDSAQVRALYADTGRVAQRTAALRAAKIEGSDATEQVTALASQAAPPHSVVLDIGCGHGSTTLALATRLRPTQFLAVDQSAALLAVTRHRLQAAGHHVQAVCGDFHQLPLPDQVADVAVAAFCLYHSPRPLQAITEISRCLRPGGHLVLATKSADSYHELDQLLADSGLDPNATSRPSLYASFNSGNITAIASSAVRVRHVDHERHVFRFDSPNHLAAYLATSPKYQLPDSFADPAVLASALRAHISAFPVTSTSTVTCLLAARP